MKTARRSLVASLVAAVIAAVTLLLFTQVSAVAAAAALSCMVILLVALAAAALVRAHRRKTAAKARILATGLAGIATITALEPTGVRINDDPRCRIRLNVALPGRPVYQATKLAVLPQASMLRYQPGCTFPVRVDPGDPAAVIIIDASGMVHDGGAALLETPGCRAPQLSGRYSYLPRVSDMDVPLWELALRVRADDGRLAYEVRLGTSGRAGVPRPDRGARLLVRIDPADPRQVAIDWAGTHNQQRASPARRDRAGRR